MKFFSNKNIILLLALVLISVLVIGFKSLNQNYNCKFFSKRVIENHLDAMQFTVRSLSRSSLLDFINAKYSFDSDEVISLISGDQLVLYHFKDNCFYELQEISQKELLEEYECSILGQ